MWCLNVSSSMELCAKRKQMQGMLFPYSRNQLILTPYISPKQCAIFLCFTVLDQASNAAQILHYMLWSTNATKKFGARKHDFETFLNLGLGKFLRYSV